MDMTQYIAYIKQQAYALDRLAGELERGEDPASAWMVDWEIRKPPELSETSHTTN